jgi:hypothetical protein
VIVNGVIFNVLSACYAEVDCLANAFDRLWHVEHVLLAPCRVLILAPVMCRVSIEGPLVICSVEFVLVRPSISLRFTLFSSVVLTHGHHTILSEFFNIPL